MYTVAARSRNGKEGSGLDSRVEKMKGELSCLYIAVSWINFCLLLRHGGELLFAVQRLTYLGDVNAIFLQPSENTA